MTIIATQICLVLGAWRIRLRFDIDEPRDEPLDRDDACEPVRSRTRAECERPGERIAPWGRG